MADFGQTDFGQTDFGQFFDRLWPIVVLTDFGQTDFGQLFNRLWPGVSHDSQRAQTCTFERPGASKHHQNSTRRPPERHRNSETVAGKGRKSAKFWAPHPSGPHLPFAAPPFRGPTLRGPTLRDPTLLGPTLRGPTLRAPPFGAPLFLGLGPPPIGAPPVGAPPFGAPPFWAPPVGCSFFHAFSNKRTECTWVGENCNGQLIVQNNVTEMWREILPGRYLFFFGFICCVKKKAGQD